MSLPDFPCWQAWGGVPQAVPYRDRVAELDREVEARRDTYPKLVDKGRMTRDEADREIAVMLEIAGDTRWAETCLGREPTRHFAWGEKILVLQREIALRRRFYPGWIETGRLTAGAADAQARRLEAVHWDYWHDAFLWTASNNADPQWHLANAPDPAIEQAREELRRHLSRFTPPQQAALELAAT